MRLSRTSGRNTSSCCFWPSIHLYGAVGKNPRWFHQVYHILERIFRFSDTFCYCKLHQPRSLYFTPPLVSDLGETRGGKIQNVQTQTPKFSGRLRRPKSTYKKLIYTLLLLFSVSPPQARKNLPFSHPFWPIFLWKSTIFQRFADLKSPKFSHPD